MKIGIAYDTPEMYDLKSDRIYYDFAEQISIIELQKIIQKSGHTVNLVGNAKNIIKLIKQDDFEYDLIYNTVEGLGSRNREGLVPAILDNSISSNHSTEIEDSFFFEEHVFCTAKTNTFSTKFTSLNCISW